MFNFILVTDYDNAAISVASLEERRLNYRLEYGTGELIEMRRSHIIEDMVAHYNHVQDLKWESFVFKDEVGAGDGVTRDVISTVMKEFDGAAEKVPSLSCNEEELEAFGKAISQGFLQFGLFPPTLCKASLVYGFVQDCSPELLYSSFLNFLPGNSLYVLLPYPNIPVDICGLTFSNFQEG